MEPINYLVRTSHCSLTMTGPHDARHRARLTSWPEI